MEQLITAKLMTEYLGISYQTLDKWCREGLLGTEHTQKLGHGRSRQFGLADVVLARLLREILSFGGSFGRARSLSRMFHINMKKSGPENVVLTLKAGQDASFLLTLDFRDSIDHLHESITAIPVKAVYEDVKKVFPQLDTPKSWRQGDENASS